MSQIVPSSGVSGGTGGAGGGGGGGGGGGTSLDESRARYKEMLSRQRDLQQSKDKEKATLLSVLFMTQITELKMLLDIDRNSHRLYDIVLSMLVASIVMLVCVGLLMMYVGNLRYRRPGAWRRALKRCLLCRYQIICGCCHRTRTNRPTSRRTNSYPLIAAVSGLHQAGSQRSLENGAERELNEGAVHPSTPPQGLSSGYGRSTPRDNHRHHTSRTMDMDSVDDTPERGGGGGEGGGGCCECRWLDKSGDSEADMDVDRLDAEIEGFRVKIANCVVRLVRATNRCDELEELNRRLQAQRSHGGRDSVLTSPRDGKDIASRDGSRDREGRSSSRNGGGGGLGGGGGVGGGWGVGGGEGNELQDELRASRTELQCIRREKEQYDRELELAECRRQQATVYKEQREEREEIMTFKKIMFWQHLATYVLYFICLLNIFITAFGLYASGGSPAGPSSFQRGSPTAAATGGATGASAAGKTPKTW